MLVAGIRMMPVEVAKATSLLFPRPAPGIGSCDLGGANQKFRNKTLHLEEVTRGCPILVFQETKKSQEAFKSPQGRTQVTAPGGTVLRVNIHWPCLLFLLKSGSLPSHFL